MRHNIVRTAIVTVAGFLATAGVVWAASVWNVTGKLGGKTGDFFDINGTLLVDSLKVGAQGVGGVTYFNGTMANNTTNSNNVGNPITIGDDLRVDGAFFRGATQGPGDSLPLKLNDDVTVYGDVTLTSGKTLTATGVNWTGISWTADQIANVTRSVQLPLASFYTDANGTPATLTSSTEPNLRYTANQGLFLQYSEDDTVDIGTQFTVPDDYASGGVFKAVVDTSGAIVTNWDLDFKVAISQATGSSNAWDTDMDDETAVDVSDSPNKPRVMTFTPTDQADISAGDTVFFNLFPKNNTGAGEPNVEIYNVWFEYAAKQ